MKTTIKVMSIIAIVIGGIAILYAFSSDDPMASFVGGCFWVAMGILNLSYIKGKN